MTLIVTLDLGMCEWNFDSLQIVFGFCEIAAGLKKSPSRAMRCGSLGVTVGALWLPELKQGSRIWGLRGKKEICIDLLTKLHLQKCQDQICLQSNFYALTVQAGSENQCAHLEIYFCIALRSCYLYWWGCASEISYILKRGFPIKKAAWPKTFYQSQSVPQKL